MEHCPQCGAELDPGNAEGLCAACLFAGGFSSSEGPETKLTSATVRIAVDDPQAALEYDSFGPYQILRLLGEGGMGAVYLAEQTHPIQRRVALKVIKPGMNTREVLSRFAYERQALALMDHPNIAHVYDAGATEKGRPYFIMEYIDGVAITQYCNAHRLSTRERLELFVPVCQALQHAHSKGVIHRDIKPSNVMVVEQDGHAVPKVIDFGIAKATDQRVVENEVFTRLGQFIGTPEYMSPEQADLVSHDIDTTSDVYSLGVLLYELLVGAVPFEAAALRKAGMAELLRIIREDEAPALTAKLTGLGKTLTQVAEQRRTDPVSLKHQVQGDLNWIVMKAIEKERQRRYHSVADLAADVHRHLEDRPVLASPPSKMYRARKFVRRNRGAVFAAGAVAVALIAGVVGIAWQAQIARQERGEAVKHRRNAETQMARAEENAREASARGAEAEVQRNEADTERLHAEDLFSSARQFANFMLIDVDDQIEQLDGATPAREALVRKSVAYLDRLAKDRSSNPQARKELAAAYIKIGDLQYRKSYANLGDTAGALESQTKAVALLEPLFRASPNDCELRHLVIVALARRGFVRAYTAGDWAPNDPDVHRSLTLAENFAADEPANWQAHRDLAMALQSYAYQERYGDPMAAGRSSLRAVEVMESVLTRGPHTPQDRFDHALYELSGGQFTTGREEKLRCFSKSVAEREALAHEFPANAQFRYQLSEALSEQSSGLQQLNRGPDAIRSARRALTIQEQLAGSDPRNAYFQLRVTTRQRALAKMLVEAGKRDEAMELCRQSVAIMDKLVTEQPVNPEFRFRRAAGNFEIAELLSSTSDHSERISHLRKAHTEMAELRRQFPDRLAYLINLVVSGISLSKALRAGGDRPAAIAVARQAVVEAEQSIAASQAGDSHRLAAAWAHEELAYELGDAGRIQEAIAEYQKAVALEEPLAARHPENKEYASALSYSCAAAAFYYARSNDWTSVMEYGGKALRYLDAEQVVSSGDIRQASALFSALDAVGRAYAGQGDHPHAVETYRRLAEIRAKFAALDASSVSRANDYVSALRSLAGQLINEGDRQGALETYQRARTVLDQFDASKMATLSQRESLAAGYRYLSTNLAYMNEDAAALATARTAVRLYDPLYKADPKSTANINGLIGARQAHAAALNRSGDRPGAIDEYRSVMDLELSTASSVAYSAPLVRAVAIQRIIAGLETRLGDATAAERDFRKAIELYQQGLARAEKLWNDDRTNYSALENGMLLAERGIAEIQERLGQPAEALRHWTKVLEYAKILVASDSKNQMYIQDLRYATHVVERVEWEKSGEKGDYLRIAGPELLESTASGSTWVPLTLAGVRADVAGSYLNVGRGLDSDGDLERTHAAAFKALAVVYKIEDGGKDKYWLENSLHGWEMYDLTGCREVTLQVQQGKQPILKCAHFS